jgi:hypothetical protein
VPASCISFTVDERQGSIEYSTVSLDKRHIKQTDDSHEWRHTPLIPALGRQRQVDLWVWGQPGLQSEFQDSQGYTEKLCLKKKKIDISRHVVHMCRLRWYLLLWVFCLYVYMCILSTQCPQSSEDSIRPPGTGVTHSREMPHWCWESIPGPLQEQPVRPLPGPGISPHWEIEPS